MIGDKTQLTRLTGISFGIYACLSAACGEISTTADDDGIGGSAMNGGAGAGAAGAAGSGGRGGQMGLGGVSGGTGVDAGPDGAAAASQGGGYVLPAGCPIPTAIPAPGQTVVIQSVRFEPGEVVVKNVSNTNQTILGGRQGWQWCNFPVYWNVVLTDEDVVLAPGETYAFIPINNTQGQWDFDRDGGELGIYTAPGTFTTVDAVVAFAIWGDAASSREPTGVMAGRWTNSERIEIGPNDAGFVIVGDATRAEGYEAVPSRCLVLPPNRSE